MQFVVLDHLTIIIYYFMRSTVLAFIITATTILSSFTFKERADNYVVDVKKSTLKWTAYEVVGQHTGTVKISNGTLVANGNNLSGGSFTADMNSIVISDLKGNSNKTLMNHLKADDFFSVYNHPTATFTITKVSPGTDRVNITGNLSIKGVVNSITFPATVKIQNNQISAVAENIRVDRTKYDIKYRSESIFGDIGDKAIKDEFQLSVNLVAKK